MCEDFTVKKKSRICFGSGKERPIFPSCPIYNRVGAEFPWSGTLPGPGWYENHQKDSFIYVRANQITSTKGYMLGARTAPQRPHTVVCHSSTSTYNPTFSPTKQLKTAYCRPFSSLCPRFADTRRKLNTPGPGEYNIVDKPGRCHIQSQGSLGGRQFIKPTVCIKCVPQNLDVCDECHESPNGADYYEFQKEILCRKCLVKKRNSGDKKIRKHAEMFTKVRDCGFMHDHQGSSSLAIKILPRKDIVKQQRREAYFNLFFNDFP